MNLFFIKEKIQITINYMKMCPTPLTVREMQMKTTVRSLFTPTRVAVR